MKIALLGGSGKTGQEFLKQALDKGHTIKALARTPSKIPQDSDNLSIIQGNVLNPEDVKKLVEGTDMVVSLFGHVKGSPKWLQTEGTKNIVLAMKLHGVNRIISLSGGGLRYEKDQPKFIDRVIKFALKIFSGHILEDAIEHAKVLRDSDFDWTIVRGPILTEDEKTEDYRIGWVGVNAGTKISRADLAHFIIQEIENKDYIREMPFVSY
jgi:putative NADH-flavin reductase